MKMKRRLMLFFFVAICGLLLIQQLQLEKQSAITLHEYAVEMPENSFSQPEIEINEIVVHVAGAVRNPGIYTLPENARVEDAIQKAGIAENADANALNRAATLTDGQKIMVPFIESSHTINQQENNLDNFAIPGNINLNQATMVQLMELPGIGEVKANAIIQYRQKHGGFQTVDELLQVNGIGDAIYEQISNLVCV